MVKQSLRPTRPSGRKLKLPWVYGGEVTLCPKGRPKFNSVPDSPGVYLIELCNRVYIGEAESLLRRLGEYRNVTDNVGEHYRRYLIQKAGGARLFYISDDDDMRYRGERLGVEKKARLEATDAGCAMLNKGAVRDVEYRKFEVDFLQSKLAKAGNGLKVAIKEARKQGLSTEADLAPRAY